MSCPRLPVPDYLRGQEPDTFANYTVMVRMPEIVRRCLAENDWPQESRLALRLLLDEIPTAPLRPLEEPGAPDAALWESYLIPYLGQNWLQAPWFVVETYLFRRILQATGYYRTGLGQGIDPYVYQKRKGLAWVYEKLDALCCRFEGLPDPALAPIEETQDRLADLLRMGVWANQADLSMWPVEHPSTPDQPGSNALEQSLISDDEPYASRFLHEAAQGMREIQPGQEEATNPRLDFILDNGGVELAQDLALIDFLLRRGLARRIVLHAKPYPTYVSDATIPDVLGMLDYLAAAPSLCVSNMAKRLDQALRNDQLQLATHYFWVSPLSGWEMPPDLLAELGRADLIISKGDANYRRWLGDRHWVATTPIRDIVCYIPAPWLALRVLKSEVIAGLKPGQAEAAHQQDPKWMYDGRWGLIQFMRWRQPA